MVITFLKVRVSNPSSPKKSKEYEFLVDSGAVYSVIPREELKSLGIKPTSYEEFILANGETIKNPVGNAYFEFKGKVRAAPVIFGEKGVFLLGATTFLKIREQKVSGRRQQDLPSKVSFSPKSRCRNHLSKKSQGAGTLLTIYQS